MPRIALGLEYDGSAFVGWQWQLNQRNVQACVEEALSKVAAEPITVHCAGRTDAGGLSFPRRPESIKKTSVPDQVRNDKNCKLFCETLH